MLLQQVGDTLAIRPCHLDQGPILSPLHGRAARVFPRVDIVELLVLGKRRVEPQELFEPAHDCVRLTDKLLKLDHVNLIGRPDFQPSFQGRSVMPRVCRGRKVRIEAVEQVLAIVTGYPVVLVGRCPHAPLGPHPRVRDHSRNGLSHHHDNFQPGKNLMDITGEFLALPRVVDRGVNGGCHEAVVCRVSYPQVVVDVVLGAVGLAVGFTPRLGAGGEVVRLLEHAWHVFGMASQVVVHARCGALLEPDQEVVRSIELGLSLELFVRLADTLQRFAGFEFLECLMDRWFDELGGGVETPLCRLRGCILWDV
mmetsp:Transcript_4698/g.13467  ORF Transcript_4698/g.13467 Transcript_4698/m.13467 type:complete len:310 (-) Transcript_4698:3082-4011(-)